MEDGTYRLVCHGKIGPGQDPALVRTRLAERFKLDSTRIERLFSGSPVVIKNRLPIEQARKFKHGFELSGALCDIEKEEKAKSLASSPANDLPDKLPSSVPKNIPGSASRNNDPSGGGFFSGFPQGLLAYGAVYMIGVVLEVKWKLFGFDVTRILASLAGLQAWNHFKNQAKDHQSIIGMRHLALVLVLVALGFGIMMSLDSHKPVTSDHQAPAKSITQIRLERLQDAMHVIQGAAFEELVPFPDTPEQIVEIVRTHKQLFPGNVRVLGNDLLMDEWGTPFHYEHHGQMNYTLESAGPDKVFDTEDDWVVSNS
ncbi:MAG: hypothetical protein HY881_21705 [Deltaproteobacteria bacterium]|nr:hypothetical protein [Deltaproteobacteria bacterium]